MALELHMTKGGKLEKVRYVSHMFEGRPVQFRIEKDRQIHEVRGKGRRASIQSRACKTALCAHSVSTRELDYHMLDEWVADNCRGLWFRGGFNVYNFQQDNDAVLFKLTWGD